MVFNLGKFNYIAMVEMYNLISDTIDNQNFLSGMIIDIEKWNLNIMVFIWAKLSFESVIGIDRILQKKQLIGSGNM